MLTWIAVGAGVAAVLLIVWAIGRAKEEGPPPTAAKGPAPASKDGAAAPPKDAPTKGDAPSASAPTPASSSVSAPSSSSASAPASGSASLPSTADDDEREGTKVASVPPPAAAVVVNTTLSESVDLSIDDDDPARAAAMVLVTAHGRSDAGRHRKHNEDSFLVMRDEAVFVIADGMGGYAAGEVASQLAIDILKTALETGVIGGQPSTELPRRGDELVRAMQMANGAILVQARENESQHRMGTTLVGCRFSPNRERVYIAHVGDSRCYRIRGGKIAQMTTDHTLGAIGITGPSANKLSRAVGVGEQVEVDLRIDNAKPGDRYLLCSDGLSRMVPDDVICGLVTKARSLQGAVDALVAAANERGGRDNITVIIVEIDAPRTDAARPQAADTPAPAPRVSDRPRPKLPSSAPKPAKR